LSVISDQQKLPHCEVTSGNSSLALDADK